MHACAHPPVSRQYIKLLDYRASQKKCVSSKSAPKLPCESPKVKSSHKVHRTSDMALAELEFKLWVSTNHPNHPHLQSTPTKTSSTKEELFLFCSKFFAVIEEKKESFTLRNFLCPQNIDFAGTWAGCSKHPVCTCPQTSPPPRPANPPWASPLPNLMCHPLTRQLGSRKEAGEVAHTGSVDRPSLTRRRTKRR